MFIDAGACISYEKSSGKAKIAPEHGKEMVYNSYLGNTIQILDDELKESLFYYAIKGIIVEECMVEVLYPKETENIPLQGKSHVRISGYQMQTDSFVALLENGQIVLVKSDYVQMEQFPVFL